MATNGKQRRTATAQDTRTIYGTLGYVRPKKGDGRRPADLGRSQDRHAISVPLTPVTSGLSRSLAGTPIRRSGCITARMAQIPKLTVRVRFPSPAPRRNTRSAAHAGLWYPVRWCVGDDRVPLAHGHDEAGGEARARADDLHG